MVRRRRNKALTMARVLVRIDSNTILSRTGVSVSAKVKSDVTSAMGDKATGWPSATGQRHGVSSHQDVGQIHGPATVLIVIVDV